MKTFCVLLCRHTCNNITVFTGRRVVEVSSRPGPQQQPRRRRDLLGDDLRNVRGAYGGCRSTNRHGGGVQGGGSLAASVQRSDHQWPAAVAEPGGPDRHARVTPVPVLLRLARRGVRGRRGPSAVRAGAVLLIAAGPRRHRRRRPRGRSQRLCGDERRADRRRPRPRRWPRPRPRRRRAAGHQEQQTGRLLGAGRAAAAAPRVPRQEGQEETGRVSARACRLRHLKPSTRSLLLVPLQCHHDFTY